MKSVGIFLILCWVSASILAGSVEFGGAVIGADGSFTFQKQIFRLVHWDREWNPISQDSGRMTAAPGYPKLENGEAFFAGTLRVREGEFTVTERFQSHSDGRLTVTVSLESQRPVGTNLIALVLPLPEAIWRGMHVRLDGKPVLLPEKYGELTLFSAKNFQAFDLLGRDGVQQFRLESPNALELQDSRKFPYVHEYNVRLRFSPDSGEVRRAELILTLGKLGGGSEPIDISPIVNRSFHDDVAGDGKGGWTDQGPDNDLSMFPTGPAVLGGINFNIIDPAENDGKSCLVFQNRNLERAELPMHGKRISHLCILHAFAWVMGSVRCHVGDIEAVYTDGTVSRFPVTNTVDGNDWWTAVPVRNGRLAWHDRTKNAEVGLFLADFKLENKPLERLVFLPEHPRVWMIAGLAASREAPSPAFAEPPLVFQPGAVWRELKWNREIEPGSILDFSGQLEAPAGKFGRVVAGANGTWEFRERPGVPVRFYGVNLSAHGGFPDKQTAELVADRFAAYGINAVRIHHHDNILTGGGRNAAELAPEWIDRADWFFACLKKRGIYVITDLYASRTMPAGAVAGIDHAVGMNEWKGLVMLDPGVKENHRRFIRNWLEHVNPYTGIAWKDDPALIGATNVNEGNFEYWLAEGSKRTRELFQKNFEDWRKSSDPVARSEKDAAALRKYYIAKLHRDFFREMREYVRSLGTELLLTDLNMEKTPAVSVVRGDYDFADDHFYVEHPTGILPFRLENVSMIGKFGGPLAESVPGRRGGKAFTITEFNWVFPSRFRGESGVLTGAYAALQGWSGLWRYTYSHPESSLREMSIPITFDFHSDPINLLSARIGRLLFVRGDVSSAQAGISILLPDDVRKVPGTFPEVLQQLGVVCRVESVSGRNDCSGVPVTLSDKAQSGVLSVSQPDFLNRLGAMPGFEKGVLSPDDGVARSVTGELELDRKRGTFQVVTPRSEVAVHTGPGEIVGRVMRSASQFENAVVAVSAMDGLPLVESKRILILHLTDVMSTDAAFADSTRRIYIEQGRLPLLGRYGKTELELALQEGEFELYAIDFSGCRIGTVPFRFEDGKLKFTADTFQIAERVVFGYELIRVGESIRKSPAIH